MRRARRALSAAALVVLLSTIAGVATSQTDPSRPASSGVRSEPIRFEENRGQADPSVRFFARAAGYTVALTGREAVFTLHGQTGAAGGLAPSGLTVAGPVREPAVVRMVATGGSSRPRIDAEHELPGVSNYLRGNDRAGWHTGVRSYGRIVYRNVYPGIDLVFRGANGIVEYDFVVAPGADHRSIDVSFDGGVPAIAPSGELLVSTRAGTLRSGKPTIFQDVDGARRLVDGGYSVTGRGVGYHVARYDRSKPLVIDPTVEYSTFLGGVDIDRANAVATDGAGNTYLTGFTSSPLYPTSEGAYSREPAGATIDGDVFVTKLDPEGRLVYSTYIGGFHPEEGRGIAVFDGLAYVTGRTQSWNFPTHRAVQPGLAGNVDTFLTVLSADGRSLASSTYFGGISFDEGFAVAAGPQGAVVAGRTCSPNLRMVGAIQPIYRGECDHYLAAFDADPTALRWSTYVGVGGTREFSELESGGVALDAAGDVHIAATTTSSSLPVTNAFQPLRRGGSDAYVMKVASNGSAIRFASYLGGTADDAAYGVAVDASGVVSVAGGTSSPNFPRVGTTTPYAGAGDAFVARIAPDGSAVVRSALLGGSAEDVAYSIGADAAGGLILAGATTSTNFPVREAVQPRHGGSMDAWVARLDAGDLSTRYSSFLGGGETDYAFAAADASGAAYLSGFTQSIDFPTHNPFQRRYAGFRDAFAARITPEGSMRLCIENGIDALRNTPARRTGSGTVHRAEHELQAARPLAGTADDLHEVNCKHVVPVEEQVDERVQ